MTITAATTSASLLLFLAVTLDIAQGEKYRPFGTYTPYSLVTDSVREAFSCLRKGSPSSAFYSGKNILLIRHVDSHCIFLAVQAAIDLDIASMLQTAINIPKRSLDEARDLYTTGANSQPFAILQLVDPLPIDLVHGALVTGVGQNGQETRGNLIQDAPASSAELWVAYEVSDSHESPTGCRVGNGSLQEQVFDGCFVEDGSLTVASSDGNLQQYAYNYALDDDNQSAHSLQTIALSSFLYRSIVDDEFYDDMKVFNEYYGTPDYADKIVTAAFDGASTTMVRGNMDFGGLAEADRAGTYPLVPTTPERN